MMSVIEVRDLRKTYRDGLFGQRKIHALKGISFQVPPGEIFGLLGPNGAGKTTLIKVLLGIVRKSGGDATLLGYPAGQISSRRKVGYLPEGHRIPRHLTGFTALEYYGGLSGLSAREVRNRRGDLLARVGLSKWGQTSVHKYSKGMLQRLGLAQAMLHQPDLLVLDEPTDGVDPVGRKEIRDVLLQWKAEGKSVFINSHLLQEIELVCDRVAILYGGELRALDNIEQIRQTVGADTAGQIILKLIGPEPAIRSVFQDRLVSLTASTPNHWSAIARIGTQAEVDHCLDALRAKQISIESLVPRKLTLEEAFVKLIGDEK